MGKGMGPPYASANAFDHCTTWSSIYFTVTSRNNITSKSSYTRNRATGDVPT